MQAHDAGNRQSAQRIELGHDRPEQGRRDDRAAVSDTRRHSRTIGEIPANLQTMNQTRPAKRSGDVIDSIGSRLPSRTTSATSFAVSGASSTPFR
jgi:hypothetical protein